MNFTADYHFHTNYSDGRASLKACVKSAKNKGLNAIAVTDHGYDIAFKSMTYKKFLKQTNEIKKLKSEKLKIYHGLETNLINSNGDVDINKDTYNDIDVLVFGYHRYLKLKDLFKDFKFIFLNGFGTNKQREQLKDINTKAYLNALNKYPIDVIAHLNFRALVDVKEILKVAKEKDVYIELNESHVFTLNGYGEDIIKSGVKLIVGSDAHGIKKIGKHENIEKFIKENNIPLDRVYGIDGNVPTFKDKKGEL